MIRGAARRAAKRERNEEQLLERKQECVQALLNRPWVAKEEHAELYYAVKDHYEELRSWFMDKAGLPLLLTRTMAKLDKTPVAAYPWMGFEEFSERQDYVFFTYGLWYMESKTELDQFLLSEMVEQIREQMIAGGMDADWMVYSHRLSMARALKKLRTLGVLVGVDGDEASWAQKKERNVLYECSPTARYVLRRFPRDIAECQSLEQLQDPIAYADTTDGQNGRIRHRVYRRLLFEPLVEDRDWSAEELKYVQGQRRTILDQLEKTVGWIGRRYREGMVLFHPGLTSVSELFPTQAAVSDLVLLVSGELRRMMQEEGLIVGSDGRIRLLPSELERVLMRLKEQYKDYWIKDWRDNLSSSELALLCVEHLHSWGLAERLSGGEVEVSALLGRWRAEYGEEERT
ncbi:TIGR02678 family protein [Paenibacillus albicereus]|uniref:TIGR02678 family protein n=1 Tax=Paenibacillus albicereus TaxID=2726185 RepID=A0A6H2GSS8_9BACL|nr:TIGR02678 family protein [Paenibacillus albicereus]QJC50409.1 TIGR02678 family protein [Paenibacillus albicereus]